MVEKENGLGHQVWSACKDWIFDRLPQCDLFLGTTFLYLIEVELQNTYAQIKPFSELFVLEGISTQEREVN